MAQLPFTYDVAQAAVRALGADPTFRAILAGDTEGAVYAIVPRPTGIELGVTPGTAVAKALQALPPSARITFVEGGCSYELPVVPRIRPNMARLASADPSSRSVDPIGRSVLRS